MTEDGEAFLRDKVAEARHDVEVAEGYLASRREHLEALEADLRDQTSGPVVYIRVPSWQLMPEFGAQLEVLLEAQGSGFWMTLDRTLVGDRDVRIRRLVKMLEGKHDGNMIRVGRIREVLEGDE